MEDMSIQLTLTVEEIQQLEKVIGYEIEDKEDLYQAVLMAIEKYVETYKDENKMETMYEVDLRNRLTGNSVECIYSGDDYSKAYKIADQWNKRYLADYDSEIGFDDYLDYKTDGLFACLYVVESEEELHGIGKFEYKEVN